MPGSEFTDRFRATLELYEVGENMLRQRLRRERPAASAQDIDGEIAAWLRRRARRPSRSAVVTAMVISPMPGMHDGEIGVRLCTYRV